MELRPIPIHEPSDRSWLRSPGLVKPTWLARRAEPVCGATSRLIGHGLSSRARQADLTSHEPSHEPSDRSWPVESGSQSRRHELDEPSHEPSHEPSDRSWLVESGSPSRLDEPDEASRLAEPRAVWFHLKKR